MFRSASLYFSFFIFLFSLASASTSLDGLVLNVRIETSGQGDLVNAPQQALEKNLASRLRGEGAEVLFAGRDAGGGKNADLVLSLEKHSRDLKGGIYFCRLQVQVRVSTCFEKRLQIANQGYNEAEALRGLHRQLLEALLAEDKFRDCLRRQSAVTDRSAARGVFGQAAAHLWKTSKYLWGGSPPPVAGVLVTRPNKRKQVVSAAQASQRLKEALNQVFDPGQAVFVAGDELSSLLRKSSGSPLSLASALGKGSPLPPLAGLDYLIHGKLQEGPLGYRLDLRVLNAKSGAQAASSLGCCDREDSLPVEPLMDSVGFEVIPGR